MTKKQRRSIRLQGYDYTQAGAYFVTICTHQHRELFGQVVNSEMQLNQFGEIVRTVWFQTTQVRSNVVLYDDELIIMPNHLHGIVWITGSSVGATRRMARATRRMAPTKSLVSGSLGAIIGQIKSIATKQIKATPNPPDTPIWQRNYWEHIIRTEVALTAIQQYIRNNPRRWQLDRYNSEANGPDPLARTIWTMLQS